MPAAPSRPDLLALVADGSRFGQEVVRSALARAGVSRVVTAQDGAETVSALADARPDLLVLDWDIPVINAREIVAMARDPVRSHAPSIPVVITMAEPTRSTLASLAGLRVDAVLARPFSMRSLASRVGPLIAAAS